MIDKNSQYRQVRGNERKGQPKGARMKAAGLRERAWWMIRKLVNFTVQDLLSVIAIGTEKAAHKNLTKFMSALTRAGILTAEMTQPKAGQGGWGNYRYRLVRDLGRLSPAWRQEKDEIYDPNSNTVFACTPSKRAKKQGNTNA